jgi:OmpA-like transmembrane domain
MLMGESIVARPSKDVRGTSKNFRLRELRGRDWKDSMKTYSFVQITVCALLLTALAGPAQAQSRDREDISATPVIVTPFLSLGDPLSSRVGTAITFPVTETISLEAELGYRRAELNALSAHLSALYDLPQWRRITPYLAAGAGLEQYGTALKQPDGTLATQARTAFSINAGGGVKVPVNDDWGLRTDARWFNGLGKQASEHWRVYNGVSWRTGGK